MRPRWTHARVRQSVWLLLTVLCVALWLRLTTIRFGLPALESSHRRILVVLLQGRHLGLLVDSMTEVVRVSRASLRATPHMLPQTSACYLAGACHVRQATVLLLNLNSLLAGAAAAIPVEVPVC